MFTRENQRHACGTGDEDVVRNRPEALVSLYRSILAFAQALGPIEVVARQRYVLLRSVRIFSDLVIMTDAVRIAIHLPRRVESKIFFKVVSDERAVTHVAKLSSAGDWLLVKDNVREAYEWSLVRGSKVAKAVT